MKYILVIVVALCSIKTAYAQDSSELVKIGVIAPLTGPSSAIGKEITRTLSLLEDIWRTNRTKFDVRFSFEDGKAALDSSPTTALKKLVSSDGVKFFIVATSGEIMQVGPLADKMNLLMLAPYATVPAVKSLGDRVFRTAIDVERGAELLSMHLQKHSDLPIAIITEQHTFTIGASEQLRLRLPGKIVADETYLLDDVDLRSVLLRANSKLPKSFYFSCARPNTCAQIINQARQLGIEGQIYSFIHMSDPDFLKSSFPHSEGMRFVSPPDEQTSSPEFISFKAKYRERYGQGPENDFLMRSTYDAAISIRDGIEAVGASPGKVSGYLKSYQVQGALGLVSFDENGDIESLNYVIKEIRGGKVESLAN